MTTTHTTLPVIDFTRVGPPVGARFPDVRLPDQRGRLVDLHDERRGRPALVVVFRSAAWWPYCKTQLVELQHAMPGLDRAGYAVFAVSYDPVEVLAGFADKHGLTYTLLSDVGSHTLRRLGLLNEYVVEQSAFYGIELKPHHYNTPYPGYFALDENGIVVNRRFEQSYRVRPSAPVLLRDVLQLLSPPPLGEALTGHEGSVAADARPSPTVARVDKTLPGGEVQARVWLDPPAYRPYQELLLHAQLTIPPGLHIYGLPVPEGYTPLTIAVDPVPHLVVGPAQLPEPRPFTIEGIDEQFFIYEGVVRATVPLHVDAVPAPGPVDLTVRIRYAACSETECFPPDALELRAPLAADDLVRG